MIKSTDEILQSLIRRLGISPHASKSLQDQLFEFSYYRYQHLKDVLRAIFSTTGTPLKSMLMLVLDDESKTLPTLSNEINQYYLNAQTNSKIEIQNGSFTYSADTSSKWGFVQEHKNGAKRYAKDVDGLTLGDPFAFFYLDLLSSRQKPLSSNIWGLSDTIGDTDTSIATLLFMMWLSEKGGRGTIKEYRRDIGYFPSQPANIISRLENAGLVQSASDKRYFSILRNEDNISNRRDNARTVSRILNAVHDGKTTYNEIAEHSGISISTVTRNTNKLVGRGVLHIDQDRHEVSLLPRGYHLIEQLYPLLELVGFYDARKKAGRMGHPMLETRVVPNYSDLLHNRRTHVDPLLTGYGHEECMMMFREAREFIALNK